MRLSQKRIILLFSPRIKSFGIIAFEMLPKVGFSLLQFWILFDEAPNGDRTQLEIVEMLARKTLSTFAINNQLTLTCVNCPIAHSLFFLSNCFSCSDLFLCVFTIENKSKHNCWNLLYLKLKLNIHRTFFMLNLFFFLNQKSTFLSGSCLPSSKESQRSRRSYGLLRRPFFFFLYSRDATKF